MKLFLPFLAFSLFGSQRLLSQVNDADKASFEKKFDAKIVKVFDTDNPAEGLAGGTSIAVAYSGSDGTGQKYYVVYCEKNEQDGYGCSWIYRSADEGRTWTQIQPAGDDIPPEYQHETWREGKPTFASKKAWIRMAAYEKDKPKNPTAFSPYLSGYWSSTNTSTFFRYTGSSSTPHTDTADDHWEPTTLPSLGNVPVCIAREPVSYNATETHLGGGLVESGSMSTNNYSCRYTFGYRFEVPRTGDWSGLNNSGTFSATDPMDTYKIITSTINIGKTEDSFAAVYYRSGYKKRTFTRPHGFSSQSNPVANPSSFPHSLLVGPAGMTHYIPPSAAAQPADPCPFGLAGDIGMVTAATLIDPDLDRETTSLQDGVDFGSLFFYDSSLGGNSKNIGLYLISMGREGGVNKLCLRKSIDAGATWVKTVVLSNRPGDYVASAPAIYDGRIWIAFGATQVMSALLIDDLTEPESWIVSEDSLVNGKLPRVTVQNDCLKDKPSKDLNFRVENPPKKEDPDILHADKNALFPENRFTESCVVAAPIGSGAPGVWLLPKISGQPYTAKIGIINGKKNGILLTLTTEFTGTETSNVQMPNGSNPFTPANDIVYLPGAEKKFIAQYVPGIGLNPGKFYALTNPELEPYQCSRLVDRNGVAFTKTPEERYALSNYENPEATRNTGAIYTSTNLVDWHLEKIFLHSSAAELQNPDDYGKIREGFSTFSFAIDGDDMIIASRTAADIGQRRDATIDFANHTFGYANRRFPRRGLDANLVSFHRVKNFRNLTRDTFLVADKDDGKIFVYEATKGDPAKVGEFNQPGEPGVPSPSGIWQSSNASGDVFISKSTPDGSIERYSRDGAYLSTLATFSNGDAPVALASGTSSFLYAMVASGTNTALSKVTTPAVGAGTKANFSLTSNNPTINLVSKANGIAVASTGFLYATTSSGFARISTTGATVTSGSSPVQALSRGGPNLYIAQTWTNTSGPTLNFSTLNNVTLNLVNSQTAQPISGMILSGTNLFWTGSTAVGWEVFSTTVSP